MTDRFILAQLGALDLDIAADLHRAAFTPLGERAWTRRDIAGLLASPGVQALLLKRDGNDIGFALGRIAADEAELLTIAVLPDHRRQGAGRRLLEGVIELARVSGARLLFLEVGEDNPAARALYELTGFKVVGRRRAYYQRGDGPMADALVMNLRLGG